MTAWRQWKIISSLAVKIDDLCCSLTEIFALLETVRVSADGVQKSINDTSKV